MRISLQIPLAAVLLAAPAFLAGHAQPASTPAAPALIHGKDHITLPPPPEADKIPVVDNYFGTRIIDNYRWLEDGKSAETRDFLEKQIAYTDRYMKQAKVRPEFVDSLDTFVHVTHWSMPIARGDNYFFTKRLSDEEQYSIYVRHGWAAPAATKSASHPSAAKQTQNDVGRDIRLIDPASMSRDSNTSVELLSVSQDGNLLAYSVRQGGADQEEIHFLNVKTRKPLEDTLPSAIYLSTDFAPDASGVYYSRMDPKNTLVYLHKFGTRPSSDVLVFGREFRGEPLGEADLIQASVTEDGHYLVLEIDRGVPARRVDIVYRDLHKPNDPFNILVWGIDSRFSVLYDNEQWFVRTDYKASKGRILKAQPGGVAPDAWETIVPEGADTIDDAAIVGGHLYVHRMKDVQSETAIYTLQGKTDGSISYNPVGSGTILYGRTKDRYGFYSFESFIQPPTIYRYDTTTGKSEIFAQAKVPFEPSEYEIKQVFYKSKDGTRIPMFIAGKKGLKMDGSERLLLTAYGGFSDNETPAWAGFYAAWMTKGGRLAVPNLRGGGEYGEAWHQLGMFEKKQNVFDDFYAAAEFLIAGHYTSAAHLSIEGASNGGLLMGAAMTQRPELFGAIDCGYPLLDMLRYQKFELGALWTSEYGSADNQKDFGWLRKYSPYHNVKPGMAFPAILFFTGDSDTRVDPLHARKMAAVVQASNSGGRPVLLHYSLSGGHSAGVSANQDIEDASDELSFLWTETGEK